MPFAVDRIEPDSSYESVLRSLRRAIIGNPELKAQLATANDFLSWLENQTRLSLDALVSLPAHLPYKTNVADTPTPLHDSSLNTSEASAANLIAFGDRLELLRLLLAPKVPPSRFSWCVPLLSLFLGYLADLRASTAHQTMPENVLARATENSYALLLIFANAHVNLAPAHTLFWRLITVEMSAAVNPAINGPVQKALGPGLALLPVFLETRSRDDTFDAAQLLLALTLRYLLAQFQSVSAEHMSSDVVQPNIPNTVPELHHLDTLMDLPLLSSAVVVAAQLLNYVDSKKSALLEQDFFSSPQVYFCMMALLHCNGHKLLSIAVLNLISRYLVAFVAGVESQDELAMSMIENLFPRIIELLNISDDMSAYPLFLELPISILSHLCLIYPGVCIYIRNTNVDMQIMLELKNVVEGSEILRELHQLKLSSGGGLKLVSLSSLKISLHALAAHLDLIAHYLLLLSVFTSSNEEFRRRIANYTHDRNDKNAVNFLALIVFEFVDNFRFLCSQLLLSYRLLGHHQKTHQGEKDEDFLAWFGSNVGLIVNWMDHPMYANTFHLARSLSRSVSTLRTFFIDCSSIKSVFDCEMSNKPENPLQYSGSIVDIVAFEYDKELTLHRKGSFISSVLKILNVSNNVYQAMTYFTSNVGERGSSEYHYTEVSSSRTVILLALLANFILDFTSFRYEIVNNVTFLRDLSILYNKSSETIRAYESSHSKSISMRNKAYELCQVQLGVLQVIKNYLFNEHEEHRKYVWEYIPLSIIFENSLYGILTPAAKDFEVHKMLLQLKIIAFEILRNATASSSYFSESVREQYLEFVGAQQNKGICYIPTDWNEFLVANFFSYDLFVPIPDDNQTIEARFFNDDKFLSLLMTDPNYVRLVIGINYTEDNRFTNCSVLRKSDLPHTGLLDVWKRLLEVELPTHNKMKPELKKHTQVKHSSSQLNEVKVSINWILINLTWKEHKFGYQIPDKVNFRLLDTVGGGEGNSGSTFFSATNVIIENSDEDQEDEEDYEREDLMETNEEERDDRKDSEDTVALPEDRAKILYMHGFASSLQKLIKSMGAPKFHGGQVALGSMERFDHLNANDLYEKSKTAHRQIILLVLGVLVDADRQYRIPELGGDKHPLRRQSNIISARESVRARQDIQQVAEELAYEREQDEVVSDGTEENENSEPEADLDDYWVR